MSRTNSKERVFTLEDYLAIARRRFWQALAVFLAVLILAALVIEALPSRYRSTAIVSVESQQIPDDLVKSTVSGFAHERIGFVKQRVMTKARLLEVIEKFDLYAGRRASAPTTLLVEELRKNISLETIQDPSIRRRGASPTVAFYLAFEHSNPETAADVATELVTMFLRENVETRTARATETTQFLAKEAMRLSDHVSQMDARVAKFKQEHADALPEHMALRIRMLESAENDLRDLERDMHSLEEERRFLETQKASLGAILGASMGETVLSPEQQLALARVELSEKSSIYSLAHPDIRRLRHRIASLEQEVSESAAEPDRSPPSTVADPANVQIETQIVSTDAQIATLQTQREQLKKKIQSLQAQLMEAPQVERRLKDLTRDYESAMVEFEEIKAKQSHAELAENLEAQEKAERFALLEAPQVPTIPIWPDKKKAYVLAFALALTSSGAAALVPETLDKSVRGTAALTSIVRNAPVFVIPFVETSIDKRRKRRRYFWTLLSAFLLLLVGLALTHFFVHPIDTLFVSMLDQLGIDKHGAAVPLHDAMH
jgi:polysaccharide chain length determinant protein (PEP-CTERM system associated)